MRFDIDPDVFPFEVFQLRDELKVTWVKLFPTRA